VAIAVGPFQAFKGLYAVRPLPSPASPRRTVNLKRTPSTTGLLSAEDRAGAWDRPRRVRTSATDWAVIDGERPGWVDSGYMKIGLNVPKVASLGH
jgi:hypothetical protein